MCVECRTRADIQYSIFRFKIRVGTVILTVKDGEEGKNKNIQQWWIFYFLPRVSFL